MLVNPRITKPVVQGQAEAWSAWGIEAARVDARGTAAVRRTGWAHGKVVHSPSRPQELSQSAAPPQSRVQPSVHSVMRQV